jgi:hypothetical protein
MTEFLYKIEQKLTQNGNWKFLAGLFVGPLLLSVLFAFALTSTLAPISRVYTINDIIKKISQLNQKPNFDYLETKPEYQYYRPYENQYYPPQIDYTLKAPIPPIDQIAEIQNNELLGRASQPTQEQIDFANKLQTKWDIAKQTNDFRELQKENLPLYSESINKVSPGDCIDKLNFKHNEAIRVDYYTTKYDGYQNSGFNVSLDTGPKAGKNYSRGQDIIGFSLGLSCFIPTPSQIVQNTLSANNYILVDCREILFLNERFVNSLLPNKCMRMRDNASSWIFTDKDGVQFDFNLIGAKEIQDSLKLEIDLK